MDFSVIVPSYNRPDAVRRCLAGLAAQDYAGPFEVIVVDDGSPRPVAPLVEDFRAALALEVLRQENRGPAAARNLGAARARGRYLAFTDDDCVPRKGWLTAFAAGLAETPGVLLGGHTVNALKENLYSQTCQMLVDYLYEAFQGHTSGIRFFSSNNFALEREAFPRLGGFNESFHCGGEDRDLCDRWQSMGGAMRQEARARVDHYHRLTFGGYCEMHFRYGRGAYAYRRARAGREQAPLRVEPLRFYLDMFRYPFRTSRQSRLSVSALLLISQVSHTAGFFAARGRASSTPLAKGR